MLNTMCLDCRKLNSGCTGTECQTWSGCIFKVKKDDSEQKETDKLAKFRKG